MAQSCSSAIAQGFPSAPPPCRELGGAWGRASAALAGATVIALAPLRLAPAPPPPTAPGYAPSPDLPGTAARWM